MTDQPVVENRKRRAGACRSCLWLNGVPDKLCLIAVELARRAFPTKYGANGYAMGETDWTEAKAYDQHVFGWPDGIVIADE